MSKGQGQRSGTAWDRQQKPAGMDATKDEAPTPIDPRAVRRHFQKTALADDRAVGCRCRNVKARFVPPPDDAPEGTISVLTYPHTVGCPVYQTRRAAEIQNTANGPMSHAVVDVGGSSPDAHNQDGDRSDEGTWHEGMDGLTVIENPSGLWVPGGE